MTHTIQLFYVRMFSVLAFGMYGENVELFKSLFPICVSTQSFRPIFPSPLIRRSATKVVPLFYAFSYAD